MIHTVRMPLTKTVALILLEVAPPEETHSLALPEFGGFGGQGGFGADINFEDIFSAFGGGQARRGQRGQRSPFQERGFGGRQHRGSDKHFVHGCCEGAQ